MRDKDFNFANLNINKNPTSISGAKREGNWRFRGALGLETEGNPRDSTVDLEWLQKVRETAVAPEMHSGEILAVRPQHSAFWKLSPGNREILG